MACQELPSGDVVCQEGMDLGETDQSSPKGPSNELVGARKLTDFYPKPRPTPFSSTLRSYPLLITLLDKFLRKLNKFRSNIIAIALRLVTE